MVVAAEDDEVLVEAAKALVVFQRLAQQWPVAKRRNVPDIK